MTIIKPVRQELPASTRPFSASPLLSENEAKQLYFDLLEGRGEWMKFFEAEVTDNKTADRARARATAYLKCSTMRQYRSQIEFATRLNNGKLVAFARVKV